ncbi:MAG: ROK family transcriptional regulator [Pseudomonadota bacterium]
MIRSSESDMLRQPSQVAILRYLRIRGPAARIDIGAATGLSPASVTALTAELIAQGLVREIQSPVLNGTGTVANAARGRPKILLDLVSSAVAMIGVKLTINHIEIALGNFKGEIDVSRQHVINTLDLDSDALVQTLCRLIDRFLADHKDHLSVRPSGIGIAVQGIADANSGDIMWSPALRHRHIPITAPLMQRYGCIVEMSNDANCIATAITQNDQWHGTGDFAVIMLGYGVGMGMVLNGTVYNGPFGAAAEFGHTKYQPDGPMCNCGRRGCLEAYIGDYALLRDAAGLIDLPPPANSLHPSEEQMMELVHLARNGREDIADLFRHAGKVLGYGIANLIALIGPERILITGSGARAYDLMEPDMRRGLREALVAELRDGPEILHLPWDQDLALLGAIGQSLLRYDERMFSAKTA